jgi:predicted RNA binding protein YcfA (HicA-like mRNA interferase family)
MPSSYTRDVITILTANGCHYVRSGRHPIWFSPKSDSNFPVPTRIKSRHTANEIMKQAGIAHRF